VFESRPSIWIICLGKYWNLNVNFVDFDIHWTMRGKYNAIIIGSIQSLLHMEFKANYVISLYVAAKDSYNAAVDIIQYVRVNIGTAETKTRNFVRHTCCEQWKRKVVIGVICNVCMYVYMYVYVSICDCCMRVCMHDICVCMYVNIVGIVRLRTKGHGVMYVSIDACVCNLMQACMTSR
jgi:hypothetical protein